MSAHVEIERQDSWECAAVRGLDWWRALSVTRPKQSSCGGFSYEGCCHTAVFSSSEPSAGKLLSKNKGMCVCVHTRTHAALREGGRLN